MGTPQAGGAPASGTDMLMQFLPLILMFVIFWFLLIRPQQKRAKAHKLMLSELKRGDHVLTSSGLIGNKSAPGVVTLRASHCSVGRASRILWRRGLFVRPAGECARRAG